MFFFHHLKSVRFYQWALAFAFFSIADAAPRRNGLDLGCGIGYRGDEMLFSISKEGALLYKERDRNLGAVALDGYMELKLSSFLFSSYVDVGWFVSGRTHDTCVMGVPGWPSYRTTFHQNTGGLLADGRQYAGIVFDFSNRRGGIRIIPEIGYGVFYQDLDHKLNKPANQTVGQAMLSCDLTHYNLKRQWWGPLAGGRLVFLPLQAWIFEGGYYYYFLQLKQKSGFYQHLIYLADSSMASEFFIQSHSDSDFSGLHGQNICGKIKAQIAECWRLNWRWDLFRFAAKKKKIAVKQVSRQVYPIFETASTKQQSVFHGRWSAFSSILELEFFF